MFALRVHTLSAASYAKTYGPRGLARLGKGREDCKRLERKWRKQGGKGRWTKESKQVKGEETGLYL